MEKKRLIACMKALSDETRLEILEMLKGGTLCACKILEKFSLTQPTLSYHMKLLTESGLVTVTKDWKWSYYSVNGEAMKELRDYFDFVCAESGTCRKNEEGNGSCHVRT